MTRQSFAESNRQFRQQLEDPGVYCRFMILTSLGPQFLFAVWRVWRDPQAGTVVKEVVLIALLCAGAVLWFRWRARRIRRRNSGLEAERALAEPAIPTN